MVATEKGRNHPFTQHQDVMSWVVFSPSICSVSRTSLSEGCGPEDTGTIGMEAGRGIQECVAWSHVIFLPGFPGNHVTCFVRWVCLLVLYCCVHTDELATPYLHSIQRHFSFIHPACGELVGIFSLGRSWDTSLEWLPCDPFWKPLKTCAGSSKTGEEMVLQEGGLAWAAGGGVRFPERWMSLQRVSLLNWLLDCSPESLSGGGWISFWKRFVCPFSILLH